MIRLAKFARQAPWLLPGLVAVVLYAQTHDHQFIDFDDMAYTFENPTVSQGLTWAGVKWAFTGSHVANYHPLTWLSHMLDVELFGMSPGSFALVNAGLHAINAWLVALLFARMFGASSLGISLGVVFAAHPKLVEAVAWISQRKTLLATLFALGTIYCYLRSVEHDGARLKRRPYFLALALYILSLFSKGMYVTMPAVLLLFEMAAADRRALISTDVGAWLDRYRVTPENIRCTAFRLLPFAILSLAFSAITYWAQAEGAAVQSFDRLPIATRLATALAGCVTYVRHFVFPAGLSVYYPRPESWNLTNVLICGGLLAGISLGLFALRKLAGRAAFLGWMLFLLMLLPVIGIIQVGDQASADRYMYGPILGLLLSCAALFEALRRHATRRSVFSAAVASFGIWTLLMCVATFRQIQYWRNSFTIASASEASVGPYPLLLSIQGTSLLRAGDYASASIVCRRTLEIAPDHLPALSNLAVAEFSLGHAENAIALCRKYIEIAPDKPVGFTNLAVFSVRMGRYTDAAEAINAARARDNLTVSQERFILELEREIQSRRQINP